MILGIDIGTHSARAAYLDRQGRARLVRMPDGATRLPALARQTMHGLETGPEAARALVGNAETTIVGCTRLMGRAGAIPGELLERLPYSVRTVGGEAICNLLYAEVRASEVYGLLGRKLVATAAETLGQPISEVVLTIPASAEDRFRVQARAALESQGIRVRRLISQPAAALLGIAALDHEGQPAQSMLQSARNIAVIHCGGGATDASIAERSAGRTRVLATAGDLLLGGDDLAWALAEQLNQRFRHNAGIDVFAADESRVAAQGLRAAAEEALQVLSVAPEMTLTLDHGAGFGRDLVTVLRRRDIDAWLAPLMERIAELCRRALASSGLAARQIEAVVLAGDWAGLPAIRETVAQVFGKPVAALYTQAAALLPVFGAALAASESTASVWDVTPYPLGINCYYSGQELFSPIIAANTPIPTPAIGASGEHRESYQTLHPDQTSVRLDILQFRGPRAANPYGPEPVRPRECEILGTWEFSGLHPRRGQRAAFSVSFEVDADGVLRLHAEEQATGHSLTARIDRGIGES